MRPRGEAEQQAWQLQRGVCRMASLATLMDC